MILGIVVIDQLDALRSPSVRLGMAGNIRIENDVLRVRDTVHWPGRYAAVSILPAVRVEFVHEACPGLAH